jgi:hypothetical protein
MTPSIVSLLMVVGLWVSLTFLCCAGIKRQSQSVLPPVSTNAAQIIQDYKANEVRADSQYKGRLVTVTGKIDSISKDILDSAYVTLSDGTEFGFISVQCTFGEPISPQQTQRLESLSKGQIITVSGMCSGKFGNVLLSDCTLRQ